MKLVVQTEFNLVKRNESKSLCWCTAEMSWPAPMVSNQKAQNNKPFYRNTILYAVNYKGHDMVY